VAEIEKAMREKFLGWQCRIRQLSVREAGGRPAQGMRPAVTLPGETEPIGRIVTLIVKLEPDSVTAEFRHMVRKTQDPAQRLQSALRFLSASYYQYADEFSEEMTALFGIDSPLVEHLLAHKGCVLRFEHGNQSYQLPSFVRELVQSDPVFQATYWHNHLFNPAIPGAVRILAFRPDWSTAHADQG